MNPTRIPATALLFSSLIALAGCPQSGGTGSPITPSIAATATRGTAPLTVVFSGGGSVSELPIARYDWNIAELATDAGDSTQYTFTSPGRYMITLTVTDEQGRAASTQIDIHIEGGPVHAVISANPTGGTAPLAVSFDGANTVAENDTIHDWYWDFGDGETSRESAPLHVYTRGGTFTIRLRAVSGGGVEGTASLTIEIKPPPDANEPSDTDPNQAP